MTVPPAAESNKFWDFVMSANDAAKECTEELLLQTLVTDEYARSFAETQAAAHEELNTARALAHSRLVDEAFRQAAEARELDMMSWEAAAHDAREDRAFVARELQAEQAAEAEREQMSEQARRTAESLGRAMKHRRARECSQAAEQHRQMVEARAARAARRLRAHAGGLMPGSPSFNERANDDEAGPNVPPLS